LVSNPGSNRRSMPC